MIEEAFQFLHLRLLEHRSLMRTERAFINSILLLLELLHLGQFLFLGLLLRTGEVLMLLMSSVHGKLFPGFPVDLEDCCSCPSGVDIRRRCTIVARVSVELAFAVGLVDECHPNPIKPCSVNWAIFWKMLNMKATSSWHTMMSDKTTGFDLPEVGVPVSELEVAVLVHVPTDRQDLGIEVVQVECLSFKGVIC